MPPVPNSKRHPFMRWDAYVYAPDPDALAAEFAEHGTAFSVPLKDTHDGLRGWPSFSPGKSEAAPSLSLRSLQGQGGEFDFEHSRSASRRSNSHPFGKLRAGSVAKDATRAGHPRKSERAESWSVP